MFLDRKASICPAENTLTQGLSISIADISEGCHLLRAVDSFCLIGAHRCSSLDPGKYVTAL